MGRWRRRASPGQPSSFIIKERSLMISVERISLSEQNLAILLTKAESLNRLKKKKKSEFVCQNLITFHNK